MLHFIHTFSPQAVLLSFGPITIHWYGFFMVISMLTALLLTLSLSKIYKIKKDLIFDLSFWLIIGGILGARIYDIFLFLPYYLEHPLNSLKIWQGGLAIHGGLIAGILIIFFFAKKYKIPFFKLTSLLVPGIALGQTIGRWGNYFNQELFGLPTTKPWGIPIDLIHRPTEYFSTVYFQPTFLYESFGNFLIFLILILLTFYFYKKNLFKSSFFVWITSLYMILYSVLRFILEFYRIDSTPSFLYFRWPQIISIIIIIFSIIAINFHYYDKKRKKI